MIRSWGRRSSSGTAPVSSASGAVAPVIVARRSRHFASPPATIATSRSPRAMASRRERTGSSAAHRDRPRAIGRCGCPASPRRARHVVVLPGALRDENQLGRTQQRRSTRVLAGPPSGVGHQLGRRRRRSGVVQALRGDGCADENRGPWIQRHRPTLRSRSRSAQTGGQRDSRPVVHHAVWPVTRAATGWGDADPPPAADVRRRRGGAHGARDRRTRDAREVTT